MATGSGYDFESSYCIPKDDVLTIYGFDSGGDSWNGGDLILKLNWGSIFHVYSKWLVFFTTLPMVDGYISPSGNTTCVYEIRNSFDEIVWHSGYSGGCGTQECILPSGEFEILVWTTGGLDVTLEKIVGFPPGQASY